MGAPDGTRAPLCSSDPQWQVAPSVSLSASQASSWAEIRAAGAASAAGRFIRAAPGQGRGTSLERGKVWG